MKIDFTKPLQTRGGRKVRLLRTDRNVPYPVVVWLEDEKYNLRIYTLEGESIAGEKNSTDLINVPEEVTVDVWVNIYPQTCTNAKLQIGLTYKTKEDAMEARTKPNAVTFHIKRTVPVGHVDE